MNSDYWAGLSLLHTLFAKEHNAICDLLRAHHPRWDDERLFHTARLVNTAVMAKIHTVEWTPGILDTPVLKKAMDANWYGMLPRWVTRTFGRVGRGEALSGILGSPTDHHAAPYSMTEEFVSAYRLHPSSPTSSPCAATAPAPSARTSASTTCRAAPPAPRTTSTARATCCTPSAPPTPAPSCCTTTPTPCAGCPGCPASASTSAPSTSCATGSAASPLQRLPADAPQAARDVVRELTGGHPADTALLREVYEGRLDRVDTLVGNLAEPRPAGFGFSDTLFRIFVLMASRRLKSDRFFTTDYRPEVYTPEGLEWIDRTTMATVLLRHHPELAPALEGVTNAFAPWRIR